MPAHGQASSTEGFVLRVADVDRTAAGLTDLDDFSATCDVTFAANQFAVGQSPQSFTLDLDLDVAGGSGPTTFFEGFESGTFGAFEPHNIDAPLNSLQGSDGYRCQYNDPDWENSNGYVSSFGTTDCFLGANQAHASAFYWRVNSPFDSNRGKAFSGHLSLYMGIFGSTANWQTTPVAVLEAVRLTNPINLGAAGPAPELRYKHQVDLMDSRSFGSAPPGNVPPRYVTMLQLADVAAEPGGLLDQARTVPECLRPAGHRQLLMRARLLGTILAPASQVARILAEPARQVAAVIKAYAEKDAVQSAA